jgi:hypothetical protein
MQLSALDAAFAAVESASPHDDNGTRELLVSIGIAAAADADDGRFIIGRLALLVETRYGMDELGSFAASIKVEKKRVAEYRTVCRFWPHHLIRHYRETYPNVTYTLLRETMRLKVGEQDEAGVREMAFVERASEGDWSTEQAREAIDLMVGKPKPKWMKLGEFVCTVEVMPGGWLKVMPHEMPDDEILANLDGEIKVVMNAPRDPEPVKPDVSAGVGFGALPADSPRETGSHVPVGQDPSPAKRVGERGSHRQPGSAASLATAGD